MANPIYLILVTILLILFLVAANSLIFYRTLAISHREIFAQIIQAETDLISDISEFDISDFYQTNAGRELLEIVFKEQAAIFPSLIMKTIEQGEGVFLEFKSTLQWNRRTNEIDKRLLLEVLRSIAGFMNTEGGILLIGVDDSGRVTGFREDLEAFGKDTQRVQQELHKIFANFLSGVQRFPEIKIVQIDNKPLCLISVLPSPIPIFLEIEGTRNFYIREIDHSKQLAKDEADSYMLVHFRQLERA